MFEEERAAGFPINPDGEVHDKKDGVTPLLTAAREGHEEVGSAQHSHNFTFH